MKKKKIEESSAPLAEPEGAGEEREKVQEREKVNEQAQRAGGQESRKLHDNGRHIIHLKKLCQRL